MRLALAWCLLAVAAASCGGEEPVDRALVERGRTIATARGCASCHSADGSKKVGPTWKGLYGAQVELEGGDTATADDAYLRESIREPDAKTVKGFPKLVMANAIRPGVPPQEIDALIAYIRSLR